MEDEMETGQMYCRGLWGQDVGAFNNEPSTKKLAQITSNLDGNSKINPPLKNKICGVQTSSRAAKNRPLRV